jgi:hypothetical protein
MLWEASHSDDNQINGKSYVANIKDILNRLVCANISSVVVASSDTTQSAVLTTGVTSIPAASLTAASTTKSVFSTQPTWTFSNASTSIVTPCTNNITTRVNGNSGAPPYEGQTLSLTTSSSLTLSHLIQTTLSTSHIRPFPWPGLPRNFSRPCD